jgi:hypothetical protein
MQSLLQLGECFTLNHSFRGKCYFLDLIQPRNWRQRCSSSGHIEFKWWLQTCPIKPKLNYHISLWYVQRRPLPAQWPTDGCLARSHDYILQACDLFWLILVLGGQGEIRACLTNAQINVSCALPQASSWWPRQLLSPQLPSELRSGWHPHEFSKFSSTFTENTVIDQCNKKKPESGLCSESSNYRLTSIVFWIVATKK